MKVEITRATIANRRAVKPGDVVKLKDHDATLLIHMGKAKPLKSEAKPKPKSTEEK